MEKSHLSHASADAALHQARMKYGKVFEQEEALMLDEINKGKQIEKLRSEKKSVMDSYKESDEFGEIPACNFIDVSPKSMKYWDTPPDGGMVILSYSRCIPNNPLILGRFQRHSIELQRGSKGIKTVRRIKLKMWW